MDIELEPAESKDFVVVMGVGKTTKQGVKAPLFNIGMKENGAVFNHTQGWSIITEAILGNGQQAYDYFKAFLPASYITKAEIR